MAETLKLNKKVLVVANSAPPKIAGGPLQLYNLFSNIDKNSYCLFTNRKNFKNRDGKLGQKLNCNYYFFEDQKSISLFNFFSTIRRGIKIIEEENIDIILGITDNGKSFLITYILSKLCRKPYCIYLLDIYKGNLFKPFWSLLSKLESILFKNAEIILVTNEGSKSVYQITYPNLAKKIGIVNNCAIADNYLLERTSYSPSSPYHIVYSGSIYWAQENSIIDLIEVINDIKDIDIRLDIYSPYPTDKIIGLVKNSDKINIKAIIPEDVPRTQAQSSILFLPLAWNTSSNIVIGTATPGKLTGYLLSGRPILVHAPADCYLSKYAEERGFALVVGTRDKEELKKAIIKILLDKDYSIRLITKAEETFWANHDARTNAELLVGYINNLSF